MATQINISSILLIYFLSSSVLIPAIKVNAELFFSFKMREINGRPLDFEHFRGKTTLLVNTASECSLTDSQMKSLKRLHDILSFGHVFNVLAFPCNEFGEQEPWDNEEIEQFYKRHFHAEFPILEKGSMDSDLWNWVKSESQLPSWNFHKYLIDGNGTIVNDWPGETSVEDIFQHVQNTIKAIGKSNQVTNEQIGKKEEL